MFKISLEQLLYTNYIKYDRLTLLINEAFKGSNANTVNVYIDLYSILKGLYVNNSYNIEDYSIVTSSIINLVAHMREFFKTRYRVYSKFFIVYSKNCPYVNKQFYIGYNNKHELSFNANKLVDDMIANNIELLNTLCPYLPDIHFIQGTFETGVIMYDLICRNETVDSSPHIILSKDMYNYQLAAMRDNITILRPKKVNKQDASYFINKNNLINMYLWDKKSDYQNTILMPGLISYIMALSSVPERNIKSAFGIKKTMKTIEQAVSKYKIVNGYNSDPLGFFFNLDIDKIKICDKEFECRFKAIDILFQHNIFINTPECQSIELKDLYDPETVKEINNKYFVKNPLDLNRL